MRIAIVAGDDFIGDDPALLGGALSVQGHDVGVYVRQGDRRPAQSRSDRGYRIVSGCVGPAAARSAADMLPFVGDWAAKLERCWLSDQPDVVHAFGWLGGLAAQLAARREALPTVQTFQALAALSQSYPDATAAKGMEQQRIESLLARNARWATAECSAEPDVLARLRHGRERASVFCGGIDVEQFAPTGPVLECTDPHRILCVAPNPLLDNGFDIAVKALPRVPATELVFAETGATNRAHDQARAKLRRLARELRVADRVRFSGTVPGDELPMLLRSAAVLVCTPRQSQRATPVLQAMATGLAVIALPVGALSDIVVDDVTGIVLSADNPVELSAALRSVPVQSFRCKSMGAAGRSRALSRYTWRRIALDSLAIYGKLSSARVLCRTRRGATEEVTR
ncbi:glycosyltransferase [Mycobacterium stomatepiae]|uniref:Glycosyl transferase n=1 Tax=Mycobacterium stomatepiae TaxID=470076 RepID=A0A7I7Q6V9_9MYCO|nr:glycosyltransferase [Mycobacterium stomatepiae]MCV7162958.1 glycosyltransferase [Mycobacterium stomatepiae]BBY22084.1 glycosyl transferase [Mycobacterium stomatepiae]